MGDAQTWNNMDDREKQGLVDSLKRQNQDASTFVDVSGDTMTGTLEVPGFIATSTVTLGISKILSNASGTNPLTVQHVSTVIGGPTIAPIVVIASAASQTFMDFRGAVISTASLALTGANVVGLIRVWFQGEAGNAAGWLPIFKDAIAL